MKAHLFRAGLQHDFSNNLRGNFSVYYGEFDKLYVNIYPSGYDQLNSPDQITLDGYIDTTRRDNLILSGNFIWEFDTSDINHTIVTGGQYIDTSSDQDRFNTFWNTTEDDNEVFSITRPLSLRAE